MAIRKITTPDNPEPPGGIFSNCLVVGDQIFLAGMTAGGKEFNPTGGGDAYEQCKAALNKVKVQLAAAGATMADVVKMTVYITDIAVRAPFGRARAAFFQEPLPCSTLIIVKGLVDPRLVGEVDCTAIRGASKSA